MRFKVYKYKLEKAPGYNVLELPVASELLHAGEQGWDFVIWASVLDRETTLKVKHHLLVVATGEPLPDNICQHISTVQSDNGLVWHVFDLHGEPEYES